MLLDITCIKLALNIIREYYPQIIVKQVHIIRYFIFKLKLKIKTEIKIKTETKNK